MIVDAFQCALGATIKVRVGDAVRYVTTLSLYGKHTVGLEGTDRESKTFEYSSREQAATMAAVQALAWLTL